MCVVLHFFGTEQLLPTQALKRSISYIHTFILTQQPFIHSQLGARHRLPRCHLDAKLKKVRTHTGVCSSTGESNKLKQSEYSSYMWVRKELSGTTVEDRVI